MRIYLYGGISGNDNYKEEFIEAEKMWNEIYCDTVEVVNPARFTIKYKPDMFLLWLHFMAYDIEQIKRCTHYYKVNEFDPRKSGARIEEYYFQLYGLKPIKVL